MYVCEIMENFRALLIRDSQMSCAKKVEAGLCRQKNSVTTTEAARPRQHAFVQVACRIARGHETTPIATVSLLGKHPPYWVSAHPPPPPPLTYAGYYPA